MNQNLTQIQRMNAAALRIKRKLVENQYHGSVQIATTDQEALSDPGVMAIPFAGLPNEQFTMKYKSIKKDSRGDVISVKERDEQPLTDNIHDVVSALEECADRLDGITPKSVEVKPETEAVPVVEKPAVEVTPTEDIGRVQTKTKGGFTAMSDEEFINFLGI